MLHLEQYVIEITSSQRWLDFIVWSLWFSYVELLSSQALAILAFLRRLIFEVGVCLQHCGYSGPLQGTFDCWLLPMTQFLILLYILWKQCAKWWSCMEKYKLPYYEGSVNEDEVFWSSNATWFFTFCCWLLDESLCLIGRLLMWCTSMSLLQVFNQGTWMGIAGFSYYSNEVSTCHSQW